MSVKTTKPRGRPKRPGHEQGFVDLRVKLTPGEQSLLRVAAAKAGVSMAAFARKAIADASYDRAK